MQRIGSRAQVMHGTAKQTSGGLLKRDLKYNPAGKIVSRRMSKMAKKYNRLVKAGYITQKGVFGVKKVGSSLKGGAKVDELEIDKTYTLTKGGDYIKIRVIDKDRNSITFELDDITKEMDVIKFNMDYRTWDISILSYLDEKINEFTQINRPDNTELKDNIQMLRSYKTTLIEHYETRKSLEKDSPKYVEINKLIQGNELLARILIKDTDYQTLEEARKKRPTVIAHTDVPTDYNANTIVPTDYTDYIYYNNLIKKRDKFADEVLRLSALVADANEDTIIVKNSAKKGIANEKLRRVTEKRAVALIHLEHYTKLVMDVEAAKAKANAENAAKANAAKANAENAAREAQLPAHLRPTTGCGTGSCVTQGGKRRNNTRTRRSK